MKEVPVWLSLAFTSLHLSLVYIHLTFPFLHWKIYIAVRFIGKNPCNYSCLKPISLYSSFWVMLSLSILSLNPRFYKLGGTTYCLIYTLNFPTSSVKLSILCLFFCVISRTSCTALLICTAPDAISFILSVIMRVRLSSFCISSATPRIASR